MESRQTIKERVKMISLMELVEQALPQLSKETDCDKFRWLSDSLHELTSTPLFVDYPALQLRAWVAVSGYHKYRREHAEELACLEHAHAICPDGPVRRRINALRRKTDPPAQDPT
jgi:hypothetical protein